MRLQPPQIPLEETCGKRCGIEKRSLISASTDAPKTGCYLSFPKKPKARYSFCFPHINTMLNAETHISSESRRLWCCFFTAPSRLNIIKLTNKTLPRKRGRLIFLERFKIIFKKGLTKREKLFAAKSRRFLWGADGFGQVLFGCLRSFAVDQRV